MLREAAEYPNSYVTLAPGDERLEMGRYTLCLGKSTHSSTVQRQRLQAHEIDEVLAEVRDLLTARGRHRTQWEIGSAAQPPELARELERRGLVRDSEPFAIAVVLRTAPPPPPAGLRGRRVETIEDLSAALEVQFTAFGSPPDHAAQQRQVQLERLRTGPGIIHAVWLDGEIVAAGGCVPTPYGLALFGGATLEAARGRGAYRALISARWEEARRLGTSALLTQAGAMSHPILTRLGFEPVGRVEMLVDEFGEA